MMGRREVGQGQFFYSFDLDKVVPPDHLVRQIDTVLDLSWVHRELAPYYSHTGRPSIDPVLMIRLLIVGYVFAIRSERPFAIVPQSSIAMPARSKCSAARTRLRGRFPAIFMRTLAIWRAHWPKPRLSNNHAGSARRSRCGSHT